MSGFLLIPHPSSLIPHPFDDSPIAPKIVWGGAATGRRKRLYPEVLVSCSKSIMHLAKHKSRNK
jgi:hypothetical protein